jgi:hypothetical protein
MEQTAHSGTFEHDPPTPGPEHARLEVFIGKWINEGETVATTDAPSSKIVTSDVYEWIPGRFGVLHTAYGRIGDLDVDERHPAARDAPRLRAILVDHRDHRRHRRREDHDLTRATWRDAR